MKEIKSSTGSCQGTTGSTSLSNEELLELMCDILVPAALEGQIGAHNAQRIDCKIVVEGANGPTTPEGEAVLIDRGITVVPDILANAGGVAVSYFEWVQDLQFYFWTKEEVDARLERIMVRSFNEVAATSEGQGCSLRDAALMLAIGKVVEAINLRGIYP